MDIQLAIIRSITYVNARTSWIAHLINNNLKYIRICVWIASFAVLPMILMPQYISDLGGAALGVLWLILILPILARVCALQIAQAMMPLRKELGIFMGVLAFVHAGAFILPYPNFVFFPSFWWQEGFITYLAMGMIALLLTLPLVATSNTWAMRKLGKHWKSLHRLAYGILIFTILHVILIDWSRSGYVDFGGFIALALYFGGKIMEWRGVRFETKPVYKKGQKFI